MTAPGGAGAGPRQVGAGHSRSGAQVELAQPRAGGGGQVGGDSTARTLEMGTLR